MPFWHRLGAKEVKDRVVLIAGKEYGGVVGLYVLFPFLAWLTPFHLLFTRTVYLGVSGRQVFYTQQ